MRVMGGCSLRMHQKQRGLRGGPRGGLAGGWRRLPKRLGGGYCWLYMPLELALGVRKTVAGHRRGALEGGGVPPFPMRAWLQGVSAMDSCGG